MIVELDNRVFNEKVDIAAQDDVGGKLVHRFRANALYDKPVQYLERHAPLSERLLIKRSEHMTVANER